MTLTATALPPEIRNAIFEHALTPSRPGDIRTIGCLNLLATSKQVYEEATLLPFQSNTISLPAITDSSTAPTLRLLQRLSPRQLNAVRKLDLQVVGSTLDAAAGAKVLRLLRLGPQGCDVDLESANSFLPPSEGDLRELTLTVSSRDIAVPLADCSTGLQKTLDVDSSSLLSWVTSLDRLRKLNIRVRVLRDEQFPKDMREDLQATLDAKLLSNVRLRLDFEAVQTPDCFLDELDVHYPDSYMYSGMFGNICAVPDEFRHLYK